MLITLGLITLCAAATLFSMEDYTIIALTEPGIFHRLLEKHARRMGVLRFENGPA